MKKTLLLLILIISIDSNCFSQKQSSAAAKEIPENWFAKAQKNLETSTYFFVPVDGKYASVNKKQQLLFDAGPGMLTIKPVSAHSKFTYSSLQLSGIDKGEESVTAENYISLTRKNGYLRYDFPSYSVEYFSDERGVRQSFIVATRPAGNDRLDISLAITGDLSPALSEKGSLLLYSKKQAAPTLRYDELAVWDAHNKRLPAYMDFDNKAGLHILVDDKDATYPITIDPLTHGPEWSGSAVGVLPLLLTDLQLQTDAMYGFEVSALGDVNGDGFDDAAISAPGAIDIIAGPATLVNVGAVFIYFGSATGFGTDPDRVLRPNTPVANALFGYSLSAGNVTGSTTAIKNDVIIGAPGERYIANVAGTPATANVSAGKVYVFDGLNITNNNVSSPNALFLDGAAYFSNGDLFDPGANVTINALYGFSVGATDDMDGDGLGEVLIGAPGYANAALIPVRTGAAFMYTSGKISTNTAARMKSPTLLDLPGLISLNGLLFGFSVDAIGDYNNDGNEDVVIGAPGGLNLGVAGFLGGSAYVYFGNGTTTMNTDFSTRLSGGGGVIGGVANLFGYKVKGLKDASGMRNGNVVISSPASQVLSNAVSGLRLKAGLLNVFTKHASPAATETPIQQISSPRGTWALSILGGQVMDANMLTGVSIDNMLDANCDGYGDIVVGEPLSTAVGLIGTDAMGGAAYIFTGKPDGTFNTTPYWSLENTVSFDFGVNAGSLLGYSVAGIGHTTGPLEGVRILIGAPGGAFDYSSGIFNLGNTLKVTNDFLAANNGLGKAYVYNFQNCSLVGVTISSFTATEDNCDALLNWQTAAGDDLSHIIIEQSADGSRFSPAQTIGKNENGIYNIEMNQSADVTFYRLKLIKTDGAAFYSDIKRVTVNCGKKDQLSAYPTLFRDNVKVIYNTETAKGKAVLTVTDVYGRKIFFRETNISVGINQTNFDGGRLAPGMYYLRITGENFKSETVKIIKD